MTIVLAIIIATFVGGAIGAAIALIRANLDHERRIGELEKR